VPMGTVSGLTNQDAGMTKGGPQVGGAPQSHVSDSRPSYRRTMSIVRRAILRDVL